jgi:hypothetical protein
MDYIQVFDTLHSRNYNRSMKQLITGILSLLISSSYFAQSIDYAGEVQGTSLEDRVYANNVKTVTLKPTHNQYAPPMIKLNSNEKLRLDFDLLYDDYRYLNYTLIHCNSDWTTSDLLKSQFVDGFQEYLIEDFEYSINAYVPFTHYTVTIPNVNMQMKLSGNYVLLVYEDDISNPILTKRFVIYEEIVNVQASIDRANYLDYRFTHQEVDFTINHPGYEIPDPYNDLYVSILQNYNWNKGIYNLKPRFASNYQLDYNYDYENAFSGGNEFRMFDSKDMRAKTLEIQKVVLDTNYEVYLSTDYQRGIGKYSYLDDINGRFLIRKLDRDPTTEADYIWVDFYLDAPTPITEGEVYVNGAFCDWRPTPETKMEYDPVKKAYRKKILLKQGYYNYQYIVLTPENRIDESIIEGSFWETDNEYLILVYHREIGLRYDRVVGMLQVNFRL